MLHFKLFFRFPCRRYIIACPQPCSWRFRPRRLHMVATANHACTPTSNSKFWIAGPWWQYYELTLDCGSIRRTSQRHAVIARRVIILARLRLIGAVIPARHYPHPSFLSGLTPRSPTSPIQAHFWRQSDNYTVSQKTRIFLTLTRASIVRF